MHSSFPQCCLTSCWWTASTSSLFLWYCCILSHCLSPILRLDFSNLSAIKKILPRSLLVMQWSFQKWRPFPPASALYLLDLGLSILHTVMWNAVKFMILQISLLTLMELCFLFPHSFIKEQHVICIDRSIKAMSSLNWYLAALWIVLLFSLSFPAQLEINSSLVLFGMR